MKVLFYLLDGRTNASSYHRVLQYFPLLRQHGIRPSASVPVPEVLYQWLVERPGTSTPRKATYYGLFLAARLAAVLGATRYDVVVVQRDLFPFGPPLLERLLRTLNSRLVYDTDDATYLRPAFTPDTAFQRLRRFDKVEDVVRGARWVSVATEPLAAWARQLNQAVTVVPMSVDAAAYAAVASQRVRRPAGEPLVLGWSGTAGGLRYLEALAPALRLVAERVPVEIHVISGGYRRLDLPGLPVRARAWRAATHLEDLARFDIGLVPLDDSPFERAKFPFKLLQFMALGVPSVCARVGAAAQLVRHGEHALLASSPDEWVDALVRLASDADLRTRLGQRAQALVAERYSVDRVGPLLAAGLAGAVR